MVRRGVLFGQPQAFFLEADKPEIAARQPHARDVYLSPLG
jgi:hypothetical protein